MSQEHQLSHFLVVIARQQKVSYLKRTTVNSRLKILKKNYNERVSEIASLTGQLAEKEVTISQMTASSRSDAQPVDQENLLKEKDAKLLEYEKRF